MRKSMMAQYPLYVWYTGDAETTHTIEVDGDGGTSSAGLITITDGSTANAFDLGTASYNTLGELIAGIEAISDDWHSEAYGVDAGISIFDASDIGAASLLSDLAVGNAPHMKVPLVEFASFPGSFANGTDTTVINGFPVSLGGPTTTGKAHENNEVNFEIEVSLASGVETGDVSVGIRLGHIPAEDWSGERHRKLTAADFTSEAYTVSVSAVNTTTVSAATKINVAGYDYAEVYSVTNANTAAANVSVFMNV